MKYNNSFLKITILFSCILFWKITLAQSHKYNSGPFFGLEKSEIKSTKSSFNLTSQINPTIITKGNTSTSLVTDYPDVRVFPSNLQQSEVHISVNPINPQQLVATCNIFANNSGSTPTTLQVGHYNSINGGIAWTGNDFLQGSNTTPLGGDPSTAFNTNNKCFISCMTEADNGYFVQSSINNGLNWSPLILGASVLSFDKGMIACDNLSTSIFKDNLYCAWTNFTLEWPVQFNKSTDNGLTFSTPIVLKQGFGQGTNVQTGPNGEVYVCWADYDNQEAPSHGLGFCASINGGHNFTPYRKVINYQGIREQYGSALFGNTLINDYPSMAVDKTNGFYRGRIYVVFPVKENGNGKAVIQVSFSDNQGNTWSTPATVSIPSGRQNWMPWIAVDGCTGEVWVDYYSLDSPTGFSTNTYVAHSYDGGSTWENQKVSDIPHITSPIVTANGYAGDYIGITASGGKAYPIWADNRNGTWQIYCSPVSSDYVMPSPFINTTLTGNNLICQTGSYTLNNLPIGTSILWSSDNTSIATVNNTGTSTTTATKVSDGNFNLKATLSLTLPCGTIQNTVLSKNITTYTIPTNVTINDNGTMPSNICIGNSFGAKCIPVTGAINYSWSSSNPSILNITSGQGTPNVILTSIGNGDATISVSISTPCGIVTGSRLYSIGILYPVGSIVGVKSLTGCSPTVGVFKAGLTGALSYLWTVTESNCTGTPLVTYYSGISAITHTFNNAYHCQPTIEVYATTACGQTQTLALQPTMPWMYGCPKKGIATDGANNIIISPNPTSGEFKIDLANKPIQQIIIKNKMGTTVYQKQFKDNQKSQTINLSNQPTDIYMVQIFDGTEWSTQKLSIKNKTIPNQGCSAALILSSIHIFQIPYPTKLLIINKQ